VTDVIHWLGYLLELYFFVLVARVVLSWVMLLTQYRPTGAMAVVFEFVYLLTDPPTKFINRYIPLLGAGRMQFDIGFLLLIIVTQVLAGQLIGW